MKKTIDHPKVFISYAWGTPDYQMKVLAFATSLKGDGIDVVIDKWSVEAGNDLNSFMEKSVHDDSITNVLILLDKNYVDKADGRQGGVGTETQILSQEVYKKVDQNKIVPIIFGKMQRNMVLFLPVVEDGTQIHFHYYLLVIVFGLIFLVQAMLVSELLPKLFNRLKMFPLRLKANKSRWLTLILVEIISIRKTLI